MQLLDRSSRIADRYRPGRASDDWVLEDEQVPESYRHDQVARDLDALLRAYVARTQLDAVVGRNLAIRMDQARPQLGIDPDVYLLSPPPPSVEEMHSLCLWRPGHVAPKLVIEVVSRTRPDKDYSKSPQKYAVCGVEELWVLDPHLWGKASPSGGPFRLQVWRWIEGAFTRVYAGEGPAWSVVRQAWVSTIDGGRSFAISEDQEGNTRWLTLEEQERAEKRAVLAKLDSERAEKEALMAELAAAKERIAELAAPASNAKKTT